MGVSVTLFFPEPTWRSHPSTDFDAKWLKRRGLTHRCAFWSKNQNFLKPLTPRPPKPLKFGQFWPGNFGRDLENFRSICRLTLGSHEQTSLILHQSPIKVSQWKRKCGGGKFKYVPKFYIGGTGHVISRMRNGDLDWTGNLEPNISKTLGDKGLVPMEHQ